MIIFKQKVKFNFIKFMIFGYTSNYDASFLFVNRLSGINILKQLISGNLKKKKVLWLLKYGK